MLLNYFTSKKPNIDQLVSTCDIFSTFMNSVQKESRYAWFAGESESAIGGEELIMLISGICFSGSPQASIFTLFHDLPFLVPHLIFP